MEGVGVVICKLKSDPVHKGGKERAWREERRVRKIPLGPYCLLSGGAGLGLGGFMGKKSRGRGHQEAIQRKKGEKKRPATQRGKANATMNHK